MTAQTTLQRPRSQTIRDAFSHALRWVFKPALLFIVGLMFAPITTVFAIIWMIKEKNDRGVRFIDTFHTFVKKHLYMAIGLLILEMGILHWFFPITNIIASSLLGFLGASFVWAIFGVGVAALMLSCLYILHTKQAQSPSISSVVDNENIIERAVGRFILPVITLIFSPISTLLAFFYAEKTNTTFSALIKANPFVAFSCMVLEVGLLHWLAPITNIILSSILTLIGMAVYPVIITLAVVACVLIGYSIYRNYQEWVKSPSMAPALIQGAATVTQNTAPAVSMRPAALLPYKPDPVTGVVGNNDKKLAHPCVVAQPVGGF